MTLHRPKRHTCINFLAKDCAAAMSQLTELFYTLSGVQHPQSYLETGCYQGLNIEKIISTNKYQEYHSIELSEQWYEYNRTRFSHLNNVFIHLGDSSTILGEINSPSPKTIFLDAHYSGPGTAHGKLETPLLQELSILASSNLDDDTVIIIDDIRMLGHKGLMPGNGHNYFSYDSDWSDITLENIANIMGTSFTYLTNELSWLTEGPADQLVVFKTSKDKGRAMEKLNELIKI